MVVVVVGGGGVAFRRENLAVNGASTSPAEAIGELGADPSLTRLGSSCSTVTFGD